jgi:hypothetical protein
MIDILRELRDDLLAAISDAGLMGGTAWSSIISKLNDLIETENQLAIGRVRKLNPIDRYGYGPSIISLQDGGLGVDEISGVLSLRSGAAISPDDVISWLADYNEMSPGERAGKLNMDVGATRQQMQLLLERVTDKMAEIEQKADQAFRRNGKDEVLLMYLQEVRMIVKTAHDLQKHEETERSNKLFQQIALQVIEKQCPAAAYEIYKQLKARKILLGMG